MWVLVPSPGTIPLPGEAQFLSFGGLINYNPSGWSVIASPLAWSFLPAWQQPSWYQNGQYVWGSVTNVYYPIWLTGLPYIRAIANCPTYNGTTTDAILNTNGYINTIGANSPGQGHHMTWSGTNIVHLH